MNEPQIGRDTGLFLQLVIGLQQNAMMGLGKLMNPMTGKVGTHLEMARDTIDTLGAIEARTRGNLSNDEARVLKQVLADLRMNYLDTIKYAGAAKDAGASGGSAPAEVASSDPAEPAAADNPGPAGEVTSG